MKRLGYFLVCVILINVSCTKTTQGVHFHGRITFGCNNQIPIKNCMVGIGREYDTGTHQWQSIGSAVTDNNGYYSLITNVKQNGSFMSYDYGFGNPGAPGTYYSSSPQFWGGGESNDNDKDIEVNISAAGTKAYKFHIKNVSPVNSGDNLNSLIISNSSFYELSNISNLIGANVDTTFYQFYFIQDNINYKYSYTKNGVLTSVPSVTITAPICLDTVSVNIFY